MKEFYHNNIGCNTAIIKCKKGNTTFDLHYHLYNNPVQYIWQQIHSNSGIKTSSLFSIPFNKLVDELKNRCRIAGIVNPPEVFDQPTLNKLHNEYVLSNKDDNWFKINDLIHALESKLDNPFRDYDSTVNFQLVEEQYVPIKEEYKIFLNTDVKWGRMNLGYGTLGKDWFDISKNNDVVNDLALQTTISSETTLMFCVEPGIIGTNEIKFYDWATNKISMNNLNKLSLGRYPLGQIIITDALLDFHNNASDWYVPNHRCKLLWNKEVFTSDVEILEIEFKNTDMLYDSFIKHSNVVGLLNV